MLLGWNLDKETKKAIQDNPRIKVLESVPSGHDFVAAAKGVIAKPGMQTLSEAVVYNVPILLLPDDHPERKLKLQMLETLIGSALFPLSLDDATSYMTQIKNWLASRKKQIEIFRKVSGKGAMEVAKYLQSFSMERYLADSVDSKKPEPITTTPPGKTAEYLEPVESAKKVEEIKNEIRQDLIQPLKKNNLPHTLVLFGGVAKERLRPDSDIDILLVVDPADLQRLIQSWNIELFEPLTNERIKALVTGKFDALRLKAEISSGMELNISLMIPSGYEKIFQPTTRYFKEELGKRISGTPYHISDFQGNVAAVPKVVTRQIGGKTIKERRSPGIIRREDGPTLFGVKHRMLLTAENMNDDFNFGDPTRRLVRGMARAVLYWNDLYIKEGGTIKGIKPEAFDANYFYRLLRDPLHMVGPKTQRKLKKLYFNELRRLQVLYLRRNS